MDIFRDILILLLAHLIADFPLQTDALNNKKKHIHHSTYIDKLIGLFPHIMCHIISLIITIVIFMKYTTLTVIECFWIILFITVIHYLIDYGKEYLSLKFHEKNNFTIRKNVMLYISDQLLHVFSIIVIYLIITGNLKIVSTFFTKIYNLTLGEGVPIDFLLIDKFLLILIFFLINTYFSGYLIGCLLPKNKNKEPGKMAGVHTLNYNKIKQSAHSYQTIIEKIEQETPSQTVEDIVENTKITYTQFFNLEQESNKFGRYIGYLERNLYMIFIVFNKPEGIAFIIAIKAIARFKKFDDENFAEYYLIGSFLSITLGILNGFLLNTIL